jgi:hypothetical protein
MYKNNHNIEMNNNIKIDIFKNDINIIDNYLKDASWQISDYSNDVFLLKLNIEEMNQKCNEFESRINEIKNVINNYINLNNSLCDIILNKEKL